MQSGSCRLARAVETPWCEVSGAALVCVPRGDGIVTRNMPAGALRAKSKRSEDASACTVCWHQGSCAHPPRAPHQRVQLLAAEQVKGGECERTSFETTCDRWFGEHVRSEIWEEIYVSVDVSVRCMISTSVGTKSAKRAGRAGAAQRAVGG
jgi:hypothetical protein